MNTKIMNVMKNVKLRMYVSIIIHNYECIKWANKNEFEYEKANANWAKEAVDLWKRENFCNRMPILLKKHLKTYKTEVILR